MLYFSTLAMSIFSSAALNEAHGGLAPPRLIFLAENKMGYGQMNPIKRNKL